MTQRAGRSTECAVCGPALAGRARAGCASTCENEAILGGPRRAPGALGAWQLGDGSGGTALLAHPLAMATDTHAEPFALGRSGVLARAGRRSAGERVQKLEERLDEWDRRAAQ